MNQSEALKAAFQVLNNECSSMRTEINELRDAIVQLIDNEDAVAEIHIEKANNEKDRRTSSIAIYQSERVILELIDQVLKENENMKKFATLPHPEKIQEVVVKYRKQ